MEETTREIAHRLTYQAKSRLKFFRSLSSMEQVAVFELLSPHVQQSIFANINTAEIVHILEHMDLWRAENMLAKMKSYRLRKKIVRRLRGELKEKTEYFLRFHPKAAMTLLNFNYLLLPGGSTITDAARAIDQHHRETGKQPEILIQDLGELKGEIPLAILVRENNEELLRKYILPVRTISYQADIKEILNTFKTSKHGKVVVVDNEGSVLGVIYADDVLALIEKSPVTSLYNFAGVADTERSFDSVGSKVSHRYKWLIVNLATSFIAASVVGLYRDTLSQLVVLALYMPVVAGMGGNAATQTLVVIARGIAVGEITLRNGLPAIWREVGAGLMNGIITGFIVAIIALMWHQSIMLGVVVGLSVAANLVVAGFFGSVIPLAMKAVGKDPATSATILISTATDVLGLFVFLGLASLLLL